MSYEDRLQPLRYTSPSGIVHELKYEETQQDVDLPGTAWGFSAISGEYIQRTPRSSRSWPLTLIFDGADHDTHAEAFERALFEHGVGRIEVPFYRPVDAVPFGKYTRRNKMVESVNVTVIEIAFFETVTSGPTTTIDAEGVVGGAVQNFSVVQPPAFDRSIRVDTMQRQARTQNFLQRSLSAVKSTLGKLSGLQGKARAEFNARQAFISDTLTTLVGKPLLLAQQTIALVQAPVLAAMHLARKVEGYASMIESLLGLAPASATPSRLPYESTNEFAVTDLFVLAGVVSIASSIAEDVESLESRAEAIEAAIEIQRIGDSVIAWREERQETLGLVDDGQAQGAVTQALDAAVELLVRSSLDLPLERTVELDRDHALLELAAKFYGSTSDETLNRLIRSNGFTGAEILTVPRGRKVVHYVG